MQTLAAELQPNLIGVFYVLSLGIEIPDTVTKTDLTNIINFLCKKLGWIEEMDDTTRTKSSEEKNEYKTTHDISVDGETDKGEIPYINNWMEDSLSGPIVGNSEEEEPEEEEANIFFHDKIPSKSDFDEIEFTQGTGFAKENETTNEIPVMKSELEINPVGGTKEQGSLEAQEKTNIKGLAESSCCPHCGKVFTLSCNLTKHINRVHKNLRPFSCSHCDKRFKDKWHLKTHEMIHTGEKPYKCSMCDYKCATATLLKIHLRLHTGNTFNCSRCDKKFTRQCQLAYHELTHDDAKPFKCSQCDMSYVTKGGLLLHRIKVHNVRGNKI